MTCPHGRPIMISITKNNWKGHLNEYNKLLTGSSFMSKIPLVIILGPTAVGKTAISIEIAKRLNGEIISADSMQIYKYMDIGTAKPSIEEREGVPHHLLDVVYPDEPFNVSLYKDLATKTIKEIYSRGKLPIVAGELDYILIL